MIILNEFDQDLTDRVIAWLTQPAVRSLQYAQAGEERLGLWALDRLRRAQAAPPTDPDDNGPRAIAYDYSLRQMTGIDWSQVHAAVLATEEVLPQRPVSGTHQIILSWYVEESDELTASTEQEAWTLVRNQAFAALRDAGLTALIERAGFEIDEDGETQQRLN